MSEKNGGHEDHLVEVQVNNNPVQVEGPKSTGLKIKTAAMAQGVAIQLDFQLAQIRPNNPHLIIGDSDEMTINKNSKFVATASDDNS